MPDEAPTEDITVTLTFRKLGLRDLTGFHQSWIDGDLPCEPELTCGAGLGNSGIWFAYKDRENHHAYWQASATDIFRQMVEQLGLAKAEEPA